MFKHSEAFSFQVATDDQQETDRYWNAIVGNGGRKACAAGARIGGRFVADHAARPDRERWRLWGEQARRAFQAMMA